jgi:hypothetical protein
MVITSSNLQSTIKTNLVKIRIIRNSNMDMAFGETLEQAHYLSRDGFFAPSARAQRVQTLLAFHPPRLLYRVTNHFEENRI